MCMRCEVILIVMVFFYIFTLVTTPSSLSHDNALRHPSRARQQACAWAEPNIGMASLLSQSARSGHLTRPVSDSARSPLGTRPEVRKWAEPQTPPLGTPPRRVGVSPSTVRLSNRGRPGNRAMVPANREASGRKERPLPPREKCG